MYGAHGVALVTGLSALATGVLLYEDEEKALSSYLGDLWLRLDAARGPAIEAHGSLVRAVCSLLLRALTKLFGAQVVSLRMIWVATMLSMVSAIVGTGLYYEALFLLHPEIRAREAWFHPWHTHLLGGSSPWTALSYLGLALLPSIFDRAGRARGIGWYLLVACVLLAGGTSTVQCVTSSEKDVRLGHQDLLIYSTLLPIVLGVATDIVIVALVRRALRLAIQRTPWRAVAVLALVFALAQPMIWLSWLVPKNTSLSVLFLVEATEVLQFLQFSNYFDVGLILTLIALACSLFLHYLAWPAIQRPLYALQRWNVARRFAIVIGCALVLYGTGQFENGGALMWLVGKLS